MITDCQFATSHGNCDNMTHEPVTEEDDEQEDGI